MQDITWMPGRMHGLADEQGWRGWVALALLGLGGQLIHWAWRLAPVAEARKPGTAPVAEQEFCLEFFQDAGAPEGAVYLDGQLLGTLPGVHRL